MASVAASVNGAKCRLTPASAPVLQMLQTHLEDANSTVWRCRGTAEGCVKAAVMQVRLMHASRQPRSRAALTPGPRPALHAVPPRRTPV